MNTLEKFSLHELLQVLVDGYDRTEPTQDFFEAEREIKRRYSDMVIRVEKVEAEVARLQGMVEKLIEAGNKLAESVADEWTFSDGKVHSDEWHEWRDLVADWQSENEGSEG